MKAAFGVEARVEPFRGAWVDLPEEDLTRLGGRDAGNARLGSTALLGSRVFDGTCRADLLALVRWYLGDMGCEVILNNFTRSEGNYA